ncbi:MAG: preprotein translocase subunit SecY [Anaerolineales bacterium]|jgi:preprotein translocase subunit SecY|nr:preprotein translocase subunit SecY [Anaerolineales bacterium]NOR82769.1 preprotein translocase subunit SecY [Ardenticatenales bacterium]
MIEAVRNAWNLPDLRKRILVTVLILAIYRLAAHVPVPGVDREALAVLLSGQSAASNLVGILNMLSGGAVANFSVLAMGVYPYITASIIMQLLQPIIPALEELAKEGEAGRNKMNMYTYYLAIPMSALQAVGQIRLFSAGQLTGGYPIMPGFGFSGESLLPSVTTVITMTAGTMFAIWLGELITEQGIGNGLSIIIFGGIASQMPANIAGLLADDQNRWLYMSIFILLTVVTVLFIVVVQEGTRRIPVQYGKRVRGRRQYAGGSTHLPIKVNTAGMIPLIFAQSILTFPAVLAQFFVGSETVWLASAAVSVDQLFGQARGWVYWVAYFLMVGGFTYFYTDVMVRQQNLPETLRKQGGFIPGIRPGRPTKDYLNGVTRRITLAGALFLGIVAVMPGMVQLAGVRANVLVISSAGLLIVVGVVIDTMRQLEAQLLMRHYEGFIK